LRLFPLYIRHLLSLAFILLMGNSVFAQTTEPDSLATDSLELIYPFEDVLDPTPGANTSLLQLEDPSNVETEIEYDPETGEYNIGQNMGNLHYRNPTYMTFDEYQEYNADQAIRDYWREKAATESDFQRKPLIPKINIKSKLFESIFRGTTIDIKPQGSAELIFGVNVSKVANPALPANQQTTTAFDFDQNIQLNVTGKIGEAMQIGVNYNTEATFDFENQTKLEYTGDEDQIIQKIEAGNVSLPLTGSLIQGSQNLFGVKAAFKFGRLTVTGIFSQQRGQTNTVETERGAQVTEFQVKADEYEDNKHYFLSQFFRDQYDQALAQLPVVRSSINITKVEVYVTRVDMAVENNRNVVAFMDLGEGPGNVFNTALWGTGVTGPPQNASNNLYSNVLSAYPGIRDVDQVHTVLSPLAPAFTTGQDYEMLRLAKRLEPSEYRLNSQLGYVSLNAELQSDQVLAVVYQYTFNGEVYQVGEFSTDGITGEQSLVLKMLKATITNPRLPMWDLMMKNVYNIGAYQLSREDFRLDVIYDNVEAGTKTNYITEGAINGQILLRVCELDQLNNNNDPFPDGYFDFVEGTTISTNNGRVFFPVVEPFGEHLASKFAPGEATIRDKYVFQQLYDSTKQSARQFPELNRFLVAGRYKGEGGGSISLGALNIPQGSVTVTAGSTTLQEGSDYTVDYTLGRVTIINDAYKDQPISATSESNSLFNIQQKTLAGFHLDYEVSKDITLGATMLNLTQRPLTQKVNAGDEPISNTIWGVNGTYRTESRFITKMIDKIPLINTKEVSTIAVTGEFAHLIPGNARAISKAGIAYIDDFEGSVRVGCWPVRHVAKQTFFRKVA
jgi:cell surface protein SprA